LIRVYAIRKPWRSALRCDVLPGEAPIMTRSHPRSAAITKAGGSVSHDYQWNNEKSVPGGKPRAPKWLVGLIGVDYFAHVTSAWLVTAPTDGAIVEVGHLTQLERLQLVGGFVSDGGLAHLNRLTRLSGLSLSNNQVSDAGLVHLNGLTNLKAVQLSGVQVTDAGLAHFKGLMKLSLLEIDGTQITDAGTKELKRPAGFGCPSKSRATKGQPV
jgi:hypothetical protein